MKHKNTDKYRQAALHFQKYDYYTSAPKGTTAYKSYWDEETKRCLEGYTAFDGNRITGYHYFYLNYCPILLLRKEQVIDRRGRKRTIHKRVRDFPDFWDSDYEYFHMVEYAEYEGKHLVIIKARAKGFSFKNGSMLCRNFFLVKESKSYAIASEMEFLTKDGILTKAWDFMDFVDQHTAWTKKRQRFDTKIHKRASFVVDVDGTKTEKGYKSEIIGISLKNDPQKHRGKRGKLILYEEGGKFPGLLQAWQIAQSYVESSGVTYGLMVCFGTGGTESNDYEGLKELFYSPNGYNALPLENIWDEGATKPSGYFVPDYVNMYGTDDEGRLLMDEDGNTNKIIAREYSEKLRQKVLKGASNRNAIDRYIAEHPFTPIEACLQISGNIFPKEELIRQLAMIRNSEKLKNFKQVGDLQWNEKGEVKWYQAVKPKDLTSYRISKDDDTTGQIVIWEHPIDDPPYGLYIGGCDPYDHDKASSTESLGSTFIYKRFQSFEAYHDIIVAEYTGRPDTADEYYENVRKLLVYYNALLLFENERKGIYPYFLNRHCDYLLTDQPDFINEIIKDSRVNRRKGIHVVKGIKDWAEIKVRDWLNEEFEPGRKHLTRIMSEPLLEELISYNDEGNFDRVIALMMLMVYKEQLHYLHVKKKKEINRKRLLFPEPLFKKEEIPLFINI